MQDEGGFVSKPTWKQIGPDKLLFLCQSHLKQLPTAQLRLPALFPTTCTCHNKSRKNAEVNNVHVQACKIGPKSAHASWKVMKCNRIS